MFSLFFIVIIVFSSYFFISVTTPYILLISLLKVLFTLLILYKTFKNVIKININKKTLEFNIIFNF